MKQVFIFFSYIPQMKFPWPRNSNELKSITKQQLSWLLSGLKIEQKGSCAGVEAIDIEGL